MGKELEGRRKDWGGNIESGFKLMSKKRSSSSESDREIVGGSSQPLRLYCQKRGRGQKTPVRWGKV